MFVATWWFWVARVIQTYWMAFIGFLLFSTLEFGLKNAPDPGSQGPAKTESPNVLGGYWPSISSLSPIIKTFRESCQVVVWVIKVQTGLVIIVCTLEDRNQNNLMLFYNCIALIVVRLRPLSLNLWILWIYGCFNNKLKVTSKKKIIIKK